MSLIEGNATRKLPMVAVMFSALQRAHDDAVPWLLDLMHHFRVMVIHDDLALAFDWLLNRHLPRGRIAWDDVPFKLRPSKMPQLLPNVVRLAVEPPADAVTVIVAGAMTLPDPRALIAEHGNSRATLAAQEEARA